VVGNAGNQHRVLHFGGDMNVCCRR
jgi:hypothetical protein